MIELAELYLLRGQIQYEACRIFTSQSSNTAAERIHFPFDVGSSQLLFNIHTLSLQLQDLVGKGRQERKSFQSCASKLLDRIQITKYRHFTQQPLKGIPPPLSAVVGSLTATNLTSKAKMIPYNNPADLLWDAMKWYRRAFDLFHAAGDQISAAKSANHIAECHLLPTFVPHLFFNLPLNVAIDLSLYQGVEAPLNLHRANTQPPISSPSTPSNASHHNDLHNIPFDHPQSSTTGTTRSAVSSVNAPTGNKNQQHHSPSAALHHPSTSKPPLPAANKTLAMSGATVVKRFASLEEVEKVSLFALEKFLEAYVCPLELIQSYLNLAEMMLITGNVQDSLHFWWEAKELFLHLFVDGCFIPISRVCSLDYLDKLVSVLDRIVRCLWKWDKNIRNSHLNLLEIHNLVNIERKRRAKRHTMTYQVNQQHVYEFLHHIFDAHTLLQLDGRNYTTKGESTATNTLRTSSTTSEAIGHNHFTTVSIPTSLSAAENKPVSLSKKPRRKKKGVFAKIRKSLLSLVGRSDHIVADSRGDGFKSSPFLTSSNRQQALQPHFDYHLIEGMIQDMCSDLKDKSDMAFYLDVIKPLISDRIMDFGWSNFIDYHKHMTFNVPNLAKSQSRDSVASSTDPRNRSTDSNIPIGGAMSSTRSSSILRLSTQTAASYRHSSHGKDKDDRFITEAVLNIARRSSFQCKRMPRFLKPFTVTWGDIINSDSSFVKDEEEDKEIAFDVKGNGSDSLPQSNYLYNSGGEGTKRKSVLDVLSLSRDPLVNLLINEKPVDPLYDFDWMDDTYTLSYVPSLLVSRSTSRSTLESNLPEIGSELSSLSSFNEDSLRTIEATAERVLVYRVWALLQRNHNFMIAPYRRHALTFSTIGKIMRTSLSKISHNMLRLKAFSRQLKGSFLSFDHLLLLLQKNADFSSSPSEATVHAPGSADFEGNDIASSSNKFLRLQYRLPKLLYMISVDNLLLAYHPFSSRETIQILNQDCLSFNHSSSFYQGLSGVSSASHSQSNYDLVSHKLSTNATHNASIAAIKATGSNAPILSTSFPQTTYPPHQIQTEGIATADDSFTTAMTDFKTSAIEFSDHQLCFLFDLFTQNYDYQCAGGYQNRHFLLQQLREQDLSGLLDFIRLCSDYDLSLTTPRVTELHQHYSSSIPLSQETINPIYKEDFAASTLESFSGDVMKRSSTDRVTRGMSMGIEVAMTMSLDNCLSSDDIRHPHKRSIEEDRMSTMFTSVTDQLPNNSSTSGPVTLICGSYPQLIPWEGILADLTIVRNIGLMPLVMQLLELEEAQSSSKHARYSNTQSLLPALSISNDDSITPISTPATSHPYGTSQLLSEERDREQERVSSYNSYASSSSSPSMSSNRHTHHNNSSLTEWKVRGSLGPSLNQKALYVAISWNSNFFGPNLNRELEILTDRRQFQSGHEHLVPLLNASSREVMQVFERHVQHRQTDLLIRSNSTMMKGEERHPLNSSNSNKLLERFQSVSAVIRSGLYPVSVDMSEKNAMSILEDHELLLMQLDSIRDIQTYEDFWANINSKLFELNSRNRLFSANQSALKSALRYDNLTKSSLLARYQHHRRSRQMTEEEENDLLSKIYLLETNHNFTHAFRGHNNDSNRAVPPVNSISDDVSYFPILFVPLSELIDLSEALLFLYCSFRRNVVIIFVPNFLLDVLMIEMKRSFDDAFRSDKTPRSLGIAAQKDRHFFETNKASGGLVQPTISTSEHLSGQSNRKSRASDRKSYIKEKQQQLLSAYQQDRKYPSSYQPPPHPQQNKTSQKEKREVPSKPPPMPSTHSHPSEAASDRRKQPDTDNHSNLLVEKVRTFEIIATVINKVKKEYAVSISIFM